MSVKEKMIGEIVENSFDVTSIVFAIRFVNIKALEKFEKALFLGCMKIKELIKVGDSQNNELKKSLSERKGRR